MNMELSIHHLNGQPNGHLSNPNLPNLVIAFKPLQLCDVDCPLTLIQMEWNCMKLLMKWLLTMKILLQDFWRDGIKWLPMATGRDLLLPTFLVCNSTFQIRNAVLKFCRDVSTGATGATAVAPELSDTLTLFQSGGADSAHHWHCRT